MMQLITSALLLCIILIEATLSVGHARKIRSPRNPPLDLKCLKKYMVPTISTLQSDCGLCGKIGPFLTYLHDYNRPIASATSLLNSVCEVAQGNATKCQELAKRYVLSRKLRKLQNSSNGSYSSGEAMCRRSGYCDLQAADNAETMDCAQCESFVQWVVDITQASIVRFLKPEERVQNAVKELCSNTFESHAELCANILGDIYKMFVSYLRAFFPAKAICTSMSFCSDTKAVTYPPFAVLCRSNGERQDVTPYK
ncbi:uncharacterized protein LOC111273781 isoform X2 [Varroa jacobsoni]|uniref:uncharacterized protein LOC111273781 isoform X2 n=1 Tax=Varroa jacobsoni TaxID=62625 RepID=UPI000BF3F3C9|nr:uncharacterized protein LOC111273781 isoform X2 [Varroa jacobsoni]